MRKAAAPVAVGSTYKQGAGNKFRMVQNADGSTRIYGRSFVAQVGCNVANQFASNDVGLIFDINPNLLGDRVATIASTYEKYVYQSVKFTWVPQCGTSTPGSVVMVMDRDNLTDCANPQGASYLQEAMAYEHATIAPPWTSSSVTYNRERTEKKIFQGHLDQDAIGSKDATQGNFIVYTMGCPAQAALGFIVMDFVLDLVTPSMIPDKTGAGTGYNIPGQWGYMSVNATSMLYGGGAAVTGASERHPFLALSNAYGSNFFTANDAQGAVFECILAGQYGNLSTGGKLCWDKTLTKTVTLGPGAKFYITSVPESGTQVAAGANPAYVFSGTLNTALSIASMGLTAITTGNTVGSYPPNCMFPSATELAAVGTYSFWIRRVVSPGVTVQLNQA